MNVVDLFFWIVIGIPSLIIISFFIIGAIDGQDRERRKKEREEHLEKIKQETLNEQYHIEKLKSSGFPDETFSTELKELILNGLKEKKYKLIDKKYCCVEVIAEYENFTDSKTEIILYELFNDNLINLVKLCFENDICFLCAELKD